MNNFIQTLIDYIGGNEIVIILFLLSSIYLIIFEERFKNTFLFPVLLINIFILNPLLFNKLYSWVLFVYIVIAYTVICLLRRVENDIVKNIIFVVLCLVILLFGGNYYHKDHIDRVNLEKMPVGVKEICDVMLSLEKEPRCINDIEFSYYARSYSSSIKQLYGANADGLISDISDDAKKIYEAFENGDMYDVVNYATRKNYNFVITSYDKPIESSILSLMGFEELYNFKDYYRLYYYVGVKR